MVSVLCCPAAGMLAHVGGCAGRRWAARHGAGVSHTADLTRHVWLPLWHFLCFLEICLAAAPVTLPSSPSPLFFLGLSDHRVIIQQTLPLSSTDAAPQPSWQPAVAWAHCCPSPNLPACPPEEHSQALMPAVGWWWNCGPRGLLSWMDFHRFPVQTSVLLSDFSTPKRSWCCRGLYQCKALWKDYFQCCTGCFSFSLIFSIHLFTQHFWALQKGTVLSPSWSAMLFCLVWFCFPIFIVRTVFPVDDLLLSPSQFNFSPLIVLMIVVHSSLCAAQTY